MEPTPLAIPAHDGVRLAADLYRPPSAGPLPTLLHRTPYGRSEQVAGGSLHGARLVAAGFNLVVQDVRGRYGSGGRFDPFVHEGDDGADTADWIARQPWSTGAVGMIGRSYAGAAQWHAAARRPPALRALAPEVASADARDPWTWHGGAFRLGFCLPWALEDLAWPTRGGPGAAPAEARIRAALADREGLLARPWTALPLLDERAPCYRAWLEHPSADAYWRPRSAHEDLSAVAAPALVVGGWFDPFLPGTLADFRALRHAARSAEVRARSRLVVGPWTHLARDGVFPARAFSGGEIDLTEMHVRWFGRHLRGDPDDAGEPSVRLYLTGADEWRGYGDWPPESAEHRLYLHPGALGPEPPADEGRGRFAYDPRDPVPSALSADGEECAPFDQRALDGRADVLRFATPPLERALAVAGEVVLILFASSSAVETDFTAKLVDVAPDGLALPLCDGIARARGGGPARLEVRVGAAAHVFLPGHRVRVDVSSSCFPRFAPNPNTGGPPLALGEAETVVARNAVHHGPARPSHLLLPVVPWTA